MKTELRTWVLYIVILGTSSLGLFPGAEDCSCPGEPAAPTFSISVYSPQSIELIPEDSVSVKVIISRDPGFTSQVILSLSVDQYRDTLPSWITCWFSPATVPSGIDSSILIIRASREAIINVSLTLYVRGAAPGGLQRIGLFSIDMVPSAGGRGWSYEASANNLDLFAVGAHITFNSDITAVGENGVAQRRSTTSPTWTASMPGTTTLFDIHLDGLFHAFAVGASGAILHYELASWKSQESGVSVNLRGVDIMTRENSTFDAVVTVVGDSGTILRTVTAGSVWSRQNSGTTRQLNGVSFAGDTGVVVGNIGTILRTTNGGESWTPVAGNQEVNLLDVELFDGTAIGIAVGTGGLILRTTDLGLTWTQRSSGTNQTLNRVSFAYLDGDRSRRTTTGTIVGSFGTILRSTDAGMTWVSEAINPSTPPLPNLHGVFMTNPIHGFIVGEGGTILSRVE